MTSKMGGIASKCGIVATLLVCNVIGGGCSLNRARRSESLPLVHANQVPAEARRDNASAVQLVNFAAPQSNDANKVVVSPELQVPGLREKQAAFVDPREPAVAAPINTKQADQAIARKNSLPVESYVSLAMSSNPKIAALKHRVAALSNRIPQARALPDPIMQETFWPFNGNALETAGGRAANQIGVSQQVPWPEKRRAKAAAACRQVQMAEAEVQQARLEVAEQVRLACVEIWFADEGLQIVEEFGSLVRQLNEVSEARYRSASKNSSQQDVIRARLESDRLEDRRIQLLRSKRVAQADLAALIHAPQMPAPEVNMGSIGKDSSGHIDELITLAAACNPSLAGLAAQIARDREKQRLACLQQYPDFQLGASWLIVSDNNALSPVATGNDNFGFTLGVTLPIWKDKIRAGVAEASHQTRSSALLLESEKDNIKAKIRRLVAQFDTFGEQKKILVERIIPRTEDALEISLTDYAGNRTDFLSVIDLYEERLLLEMQRLVLARSQHAAKIQLETVVGCDSL